MVTVPELAARFSPRTVAIIGGGYSGMACAVQLAGSGVRVTVFEAGRVLGGRARRVETRGLKLDNGQHLLIGAYRELLQLMNKVQAGAAPLYQRRPLQLLIRGGAHLQLPALPAPFDSLVGLLRAKGLRWRDKWAAARLLQWLKRHQFHIGDDQPLLDWLQLRQQPAALIAALWEPLCLAALNTPLHLASAQVFAHVLRDSLLGGQGAADLILPTVDLAALFPEPAARWLARHGGSVCLGRRVVSVERHDGQWMVDGSPFDEVVIAVGPQHAADLLREHDAASAACIDTLHYQSITTVWLRYGEHIRLPQPMLGLNQGLAQWVFDRGQMSGEAGLLAVVISADGPHLQMERDTLAAAVASELQTAFGWTDAPLWNQLIIEKRATFACTAGLRRPSAKTAAPGLWLAGDYVASDWPATLEGAVRSGLLAAAGILGEKSK